MALLNRPAPTRPRPGPLTIIGLAWLALLSCHSPVPSPQPAGGVAAIPQAFLGEWNANLQDCGSLRSESRLIVEPHHLSFYSSRAEVAQMQMENPRRIRLTLRFAPSPAAEGGQPFTLERRYLLTSDLQQLQDISQGEQVMRRWRCPASSGRL